MGKQRLWDLEAGGSVAIKQGLIAAKFCHVGPLGDFSLQILLRMYGPKLRSRHRESTTRKYIQETSLANLKREENFKNQGDMYMYS